MSEQIDASQKLDDAERTQESNVHWRKTNFVLVVGAIIVLLSENIVNALSNGNFVHILAWAATTPILLVLGFSIANNILLRKSNRMFALSLFIWVLSHFVWVISLKILDHYDRYEFSFFYRIIPSLLSDFNIFITAILSFFVWVRLYAPHILPLSQRDIELPEKVLIAKVKQFFDSNHFLTVLRTAIPTGKDSKEHGFDFIPFMLHTIEERRQRFEKSSRNFLRMIIGLGLVFSFLLTLLAYLLINEAAAGTQRTLVELEGNTSRLESDVQKLIRIKADDFIYQNIQHITTQEDSEAKTQVKAFLSNSPANRNLSELQKILKDNNTDEKLKGFSDTSKAFYKRAITQTDEYLDEKENASSRLPAQIAELKKLNDRASESLSKPENRIPEIIKRLFLSLALATFFIAILRYAAKLYRDHYQQLVFAEQESLAIRKFYVGYKASNDEEQRKAVLTAFMGGARAPTIGDEKDASPIPEASPELLKEILSAFLKKM